MHKKLSYQIIVFLLMLAASGCSLFQPKSSLTWRLTLEIDPASEDQNLINQTISVITTRLDHLGLPNLKVEQQDNRRILVNLPDVSDRQRVKNIITTSGKLELTHLISPPSPAPALIYNTREEALASLGGTLSPNRRILIYLERLGPGQTNADQRWVIVEAPSVIDGSHVRNANAIKMPPGPENYHILFSLTPIGAERLGAWTGANINQYLAVVLNDEVRSIAYIKSQLSDQGKISGRFTKESAEDLVHVLNSGALPAPVKIISETAIQ